MHTVFPGDELKFMQRKSLAPFTHTVFTGKLPVSYH